MNLQRIHKVVVVLFSFLIDAIIRKYTGNRCFVPRHFYVTNVLYHIAEGVDRERGYSSMKFIHIIILRKE